MTAPSAFPRDASRTKLASSIGGPCPELSPDEAAVLAQIRAAGQYMSPSRLHAVYERLRAAVDLDYDDPNRHFYRHARQSHPVDLTVGERAADRIMRRRE
jgi:hypothetical protein